MQNITKNWIIGGLAAVLLVAGTAAVASYATRQSLDPTPVQTANQPAHHGQPSNQQVAAAQPKCDDKNIVGTVAGGVGGGILGNQFGKGSGKTVATVGGVVGGAVLGNQYIPTRNVTCRQ